MQATTRPPSIPRVAGPRPPSGPPGTPRAGDQSSDGKRAFTSRPSSTQSVDLRVVTLAKALEPLPVDDATFGVEKTVRSRRGVAPLSARAFAAPPCVTDITLPTPKPSGALQPVAATARSATRPPTAAQDDFTQLSLSLLRESERKASPRLAGVELGSWPSSLRVPSNSSGKSAPAIVHPDRKVQHLLQRLDACSRRCPRAAATLRVAADFLTVLPDLQQRIHVAEMACYTAPRGELEYALQEKLELPLEVVCGAWEEVRDETTAKARKASSEVATLKDDLRAFLSTEAVVLDRAVEEVQAPNASLVGGLRRYNLVHDRQATSASAAHGLHDVKSKLESLLRLNRQLEAEVHSYKAEIVRGAEANERARLRNVEQVRKWDAQLQAEQATLSNLIQDHDFARRTTESLTFRIASERARTTEIERDLEYWSGRIASGRVDRNEALTPRPAWDSVDVGQWGIKLRSDSTVGSTSVNDEDDGDAKDRLLRTRKGGGGGFASPIEPSTAQALETLWQRLAAQQRVNKVMLDELTMLRRATAAFLNEQLPVVATFAAASIPSFLPKGDAVCLRTANEGVVIPATQWSTDRLGSVCCSLFKLASKYLARSSDDSIVTALAALIASCDGDQPAMDAKQRRSSTASGNGESNPSASMSMSTATRTLKGTVARAKLMSQAAIAFGTSITSSSPALIAPAEQVVGPWPWLPATQTGGALQQTAKGQRRRLSNATRLQRTVPGCELMSRVVAQVQLQAARATLEGNPIAFAAAECFAGRLSPRIFEAHAKCMESIAEMFSALVPGDEKASTPIFIAAAEAAVRKGCEVALWPAAASHVVMQALRGPHAKLLVSLHELCGPVAQAVMTQLLSEQRRLCDLLTQLVVHCSYHTATTPPQVVFYAAELESLVVDAGGIVVRGPPVTLPVVIAKAAFAETYAKTEVAADEPSDQNTAPPSTVASPRGAALGGGPPGARKSPRANQTVMSLAMPVQATLQTSSSQPLTPSSAANQRKVERINLPALIESLTAHVSPQSVKHLFPLCPSVPAESPAGDKQQNDQHVAQAFDEQRRKSDMTTVLQFLRMRGGAAPGSKPAAELPPVAHLVDRQRGKSILPNPAGLATVRRMHANDGRRLTYSDQTTLDDAFDAAEIVARLRVLNLRSFLM